MLYSKLTNNPECAEIPALLQNIDCALAKLSVELYNNTIYMFNKRVDSYSIFALLEYKKILTIKYCEPDYLSCFTIPMIASKIKRLSLNCKTKCNDPVIFTTTTTTTVEPIQRYTINAVTDDILDNPYFQMERGWYESSYTFVLNSFIFNGIEYSSGETITLSFVDLITGIGFDGRTYVMNLSDWITSLCPIGISFYDGMNTVEKATSSTFSISVTRDINGAMFENYFYTETGFYLFAIDPINLQGTYNHVTLI